MLSHTSFILSRIPSIIGSRPCIISSLFYNPVTTGTFEEIVVIHPEISFTLTGSSSESIDCNKTSFVTSSILVFNSFKMKRRWFMSFCTFRNCSFSNSFLCRMTAFWWTLIWSSSESPSSDLDENAYFEIEFLYRFDTASGDALLYFAIFLPAYTTWSTSY